MHPNHDLHQRYLQPLPSQHHTPAAPAETPNASSANPKGVIHFLLSMGLMMMAVLVIFHGFVLPLLQPKPKPEPKEPKVKRLPIVPKEPELTAEELPLTEAEEVTEKETSAEDPDDHAD